jgi:hypothetical protein
MAREPSISSDITEQELLRRKDFLEFREDDVANLASINDVARATSSVTPAAERLRFGSFRKDSGGD